MLQKRTEVRGSRGESFGFLIERSQQDVEMETAMFVVNLDCSTRTLSNPRLVLMRRFRLSRPGCNCDSLPDARASPEFLVHHQNS